MCDSARCSQATHHPHHRPVWAEHAERTATFLGSLARCAGLKNEDDPQKPRRTSRDQTIAALNDFKTEALSQLAAQHDEITRLRGAVTSSGNVRRLPTRAAVIGPC